MWHHSSFSIHPSSFPMNPILRTLGFSPTDRVVILHADDIGSSQGTVAAYADLLAAGILSSAATMVPCPWFPAAAACCRQHGDDPRLDMGVHLTLNSEWDAYRWGPISTRDRASGLLDDEGYFPRREPAVQTQANLDAVEQELRAQIQRALAAGIDVTHIDTHMLTLFHPRLLPIYLRLSREHRLPAHRHGYLVRISLSLRVCRNRYQVSPWRISNSRRPRSRSRLVTTSIGGCGARAVGTPAACADAYRVAAALSSATSRSNTADSLGMGDRFK